MAFSFGTSTSGTGLFGAKTSATTGFSFGTPASSGNSLFGAKTTASTSAFSFGTPAASGGTSLFGAKPAATTTSAFSFGAPAASTSAFGSLAKTTASTGLFFGTTTTKAGGLFGTPAASSTGGLFGAKPGGLFGSTTSSAAPFQLGASTITNVTKPLENPKEEKIPADISTLVTGIEAYMKRQKEVKDEVSKVSSQSVSEIQNQLNTMKQTLSLLTTSLQRDSFAADNLKQQVGQELKNAEIAQRVNELPASHQHTFTAPLVYFQTLVCTFHERVNKSRQEIDELEMFLSSDANLNQFTPQDVKNVLVRVNETFKSLAAELQPIHESIKVLKQKYIQYRRVIHNDATDPFASRKKTFMARDQRDLIGPSPFPTVQGAGVMMSAFKNETKPPTVGFTLPANSLLAKPAGSSLTRSLSFGGTEKSFATSASGFGSSLTSTTPFNLQKPPSGKRGKPF